jgi:hypothetical protein
MNFTFEDLDTLRKEGYTDDQISSVLQKEDPSIGEVLKEGYTLDQITSTISGKPMPEPEPREFFSFEDAVSAIGTIPEALAVGVPAAYQKLVTGLEIPEKSEAIESELAFQQRIQTEQADRVASGKATTFGSAIREALPSLGFSVLPMAAAIPAGIGGTMVGGPAAPVTGPAAAMAASGTVAYRMAGSDMMYRAYKQLEEAKGSPLTNEEKAEYYKTVLPIAQNYGLWEAGPEAVSNAITMGVGKFVFGFGKQAAKKLVGESIDSANKTIARKVAEKGAAVAGGLGAEIASEGVTAIGQYPEEAKIRQLAATGEVSKGEQPSYPGGYMQAVKDVAPATIALYGMMGTAAGGVKLSTLPFRQPKTPEQIAEDNINLEADRVSRELSIGETDEETKSINAALETARNNLIAKKEVYTALEPNDPAAQSLGLEIREMEREVVALDNELKKRVGEPLSEPITEAERQQAELAKAIVEEPATAEGEALPAPRKPERAVAFESWAQENRPEAWAELQRIKDAERNGQRMATPSFQLENKIRRDYEEAVTPTTAPKQDTLDIDTIAGIRSGIASADPDVRELWAMNLRRKLDKKGSLTWEDIPQDLSNSMDTFAFGALKNAIKINPQEAIDIIEGKQAPKPAPTVKESLTVQPTEAVTPVAAPVEQVVTPPVEIAPLPARTVEESIQNKDTFEFEGMRGAVTLEDGTAVFRPFGTNDKYEVPINPNQAISEIEGIQWVRKGQTRQAPVEPTIPEVAAIVESQPQITEEEFNATEDDFQLPPSLIEIEKSPTLNAIADIFNTGESKIAQEGKRAKKVSATPEFYRQISPEQIDVANKQIDNALRIIDNLPVSEEQKQALAEPYLLIDQDISTYENNPEYKQYKASIRREVRPADQAVTLPETVGKTKATAKKPKLGEKGGVLIPTKEDFIQAGQNIYEAGMEFGAWAKQMIQQFGDAVREFLGEVWQAVSGAPAKFNELMGYLPKKGETGAVNVGKGKIGEKAKAAEKPAEEAKVEEKPAVEPDKEQIKGEKIGPPKKTPEGIIAKTQELLRKQFDPSKVSEQNTTEAFRALGRLMGKGGTDFAKELNDVGRVVDESGAASEISMGAALFINDLFEYSIRLAAEGNKKMLGMMLSNINKLPTAGIGVSQAARDLRARLEIAQRFLTMGQAEQDAYTNYVAEFIYQPNPTKEQIQSIKDAYAAVDKTAPVTEQELTDEITAVGDRTGTDLVGKINDEFTKATEKGKEKRKTEEQELDKEYNRIQKQADAEIEKLAKIQSDTPSFDPAAARQITNDVRAIVANDLKQKPDMGRKAPWKSMLVAKLQEAGVELTAAETLADIVWRQHEINNLSRELSSINKAIEKGPISEIVKAIKDTPLEDQQNPNWRYEVMRDYLRKAGLPLAQAERIAKLMDISLQKRFTMAQEQAFTDAISKSAPWKTGDTRSRRAFQKVLQALRAGALDPARNVLSDMAALNGWTGFTPEQYKALLKNDAILSDPESADATKAEAHKAIQDIISKAKLPIRARDVIGQFYDAQALSGIPTMTVNIFSPAGMAVKNALTQSLNGLLTARPEQITAALTTFIDSIKSWANTVAFSFKNNVTVYSNVEYLVNDEGLLKLYKRGVDQFNKGKTPRERADGVKNMMIGMMDYVRRVLNALDYGAIASLQNQAVSKYALAAMQAKGMSSKDGAKMLNAMMEQKRIFYNDQIAIGTDKNKAAVLADEFFISSWRQALTDAKLPAQQVMDAALNDAMSAVGRNRQSLDAFREEETNTRDGGVISYPAIWLLETMANAANKADNQVVKLFSRMIYGFAVVPARVFRETAWFSPYGAVRFAYDYIAKKMGKTSPYAQSLGNDLQYRQRLTETITGSIVLLGFLAAMSSSTEDEEDEKPFKIVVTGNGPLRSEDPQYYDSWTKKHKANTVSVYFGKTKFTINTMRGFEAFAWPAMMLGAVDDWQIRRKQKRETNTPMQMGDAAIIGGFVLSASLRRGPYAFAAKPLFEAYGDRGVESLAKSLAFPAKTLVPVLGASLARNLSDFLNEPVDRKTLEGALWSNVPFIGPAVSPKSLNAFGEPALANEAADKIFKLGVPITFNIPTDRDSVNLHELVLKQGGGPSIPTRNQLAQRLDRQPTNKEYEMFVKEYGAKISSDMKRRYEELSNKTPEKYSKSVEKIGNRARDIAERKVREAAKKP